MASPDERCTECKCLLPAHYGSCSIVKAIPGMADTFAQLDREAAERRQRDAARQTATLTKADVARKYVIAELERQDAETEPVPQSIEHRASLLIIAYKRGMDNR